MCGLVEFPVGTGIYRRLFIVSLPTIRVPCRYRDIPGKGSAEVGGELAFPVGTGIYRILKASTLFDSRVPCGYRDIP